MIIEVTGTGTHNKGAELMLIAIKQHFAKYPDVRLAVSQLFGTFEERGQYGLRQKMTLNSWGRSRIAASLMPKSFRQAFGLVTDSEVDVLLDASGFAFGDQHPVDRTLRFADTVANAKNSGKKIILLPQALGPFKKDDLRKAFTRIVRAADLVFARDELSFQYVREAVGNSQHLQMAPDFTNGIKPAIDIKQNSSKRVCIIPNKRMIDKAHNPVDSSQYIQLMLKCIRLVVEHSLNPVLVLHGDDDLEIINQIKEEYRQDIQVYKESDPLLLKKYIGESYLVIGSRFHALVSALSQGIPAIATSWSHKYEMLFRDYGCEKFVLPVSTDNTNLYRCFEETLGNKRSILIKKINERRDKLINETKKMWEKVDTAIGLI